MLVTAIMPTTSRRVGFWSQAFDCFLAQDWPEKELVVLYAGCEPLEPPDPRIRFHPHRGKEIIGLKRNAACALARGEVIVHWDDDDWSAPGRITDQVHTLLRAEAEVTCYQTVMFWDGQRLFEWGSAGSNGIGIGSSLCYRKAWWEKNPFNPIEHTGEDNSFIGKAWRLKALASAAHGGRMVCRIHPGNTSRKSPNTTNYRPLPLEAVPAGFDRAIGYA